jgi:hypothetical protein
MLGALYIIAHKFNCNKREERFERERERESERERREKENLSV